MLAKQTAPAAQQSTDQTPALPKKVSSVLHYWHLFTYYGTLVWENTIITILGLQSMYGLYTASKFIIADYPLLEAHFQTRAVDSTQVTLILTEAIGLMMGTIINILFAIRLSKAQARMSRIFELLIGTALVIWFSQIITLLQNLDYTLVTTWLTF
ncbi:MAG: hypothetical protein COY81_00620 [Candidatus Pacebacteria bacterium CG_4_10_14_0_8_um_filter_43_12]|nr:MAG: hypothetical protein COY81_00620 [Candidatus Pacebacteria bacterium CG_4_10_14_0_8_um_filter_43_12]